MLYPPDPASDEDTTLDTTACFRALWNNSRYGLYVVEVIEAGKDFRFLAFNEAFNKMSPVPTEPFLGKRLGEALDPAVAQQYQDRYATCLNAGRTVEFEEQRFSTEGDLWWCLSISPMENASGEVHQLMVIVNETTEQKQTKTALAASRESEQATLEQVKNTQAQIIQSEKMASLGQMVAGVAHEINNPVNFIHGNLQPAQDYTKDLLGLIELYRENYPDPTDDITEELEAIDLEFVQEDLPKLLKSMIVGTERIREIVLSLRNFSRLDEAEIKTVDLQAGIDSTLVILSHRLKSTESNRSIEVVKQYGDLPEVGCYPSQLNQVFMNIFANAIDALGTHPTPQLVVTTELKGDPNDPASRAIIRIADNGPGIPADIQPQILDPFFTTKPVGKGTGMGMSISQQIITEKHGGRLSFTSEEGKGTEFVIDIPIGESDVS